MQNTSPDDTLNRLLHTWPCFKLVDAHLLASSRAQVHKGIDILDYVDILDSGDANNSLDRG